MARQQVVFWTVAQYQRHIQGAKQLGPDLHWKNGVYTRLDSQLPDGRVRILLTEGACTC